MSPNAKAVGVLSLLSLCVLLSCWSISAQGPAPAALTQGAGRPAGEATAVGHQTAAQPLAAAPTPEPQPPKPVLKVYKVWDLIDVPGPAEPQKSAIPPTRLYEAPDKSNSSSGGIFAGGDGAARQPRRPTVGALAAILRDAIHFEEEVSIQTIEGMLLITATPNAHAKIALFLGAVRKELTARRVVTVQAAWAILDDEKAAKVLGPVSPAPQALSPEALKALAEDIAYQASAVTLDGEPARMAGGRCQTVLSDVNPVVADSIGVMTPTFQIVQWGPVLNVKADLSEDGRSAGVELDSVLSEPNEVTLKALRSTGAVLATTQPFRDYNLVKDVDSLDFLLHTLHAATRVPVGKSVLVGGMTLAKGPKGKSVYLILQVNTVAP